MPEVKAYLYHPLFMVWVYKKAFNELVERSWKPKVILSDEILTMKSKSIEGLLPPSDADLAEDVVWCLETWRQGASVGGQKLPKNYVELAERYYGYTPQEQAVERVEQSEGRHRDADREWYFSQGRRQPLKG
jgi:hypothetical protein